ncbi:predicted protein [Thalassiosira pseudonana CCMP1335]|uniref:Uncharacterized protein n=1 Tax=Thalassiosira pseudonana TaxID=35128 RepID=B8BW50_THAPS|nr:predicted protein [Thalassiosira pseudonana CCMP1335]EED95574.1 predicted protein [Thalassiosira pseudonana CCMP1335]|eukprot:g9570.t1 g9570   contig4:10608-11704(+)
MNSSSRSIAVTASSLLCLLASSSTSVAGFSLSTALTSSFTAATPTSLYAASSAISEDQYPSLLSSASLCANSDSCSVETASDYLREILHVQSACAAGTLSGRGVCGDENGSGNELVRVSEVVGGLRGKIRRGANKEIKTFWQRRQSEIETLVSSSIDPTSNTISPTATLTQAPIKPAYLSIAALYTVITISLLSGLDGNSVIGGTAVDGGTVVPFTLQEVWWAIRDGYVADLTSHLLRNGGLSIADNVNGIAVIATHNVGLTPQEVWWSIRDGYAADTLFSSSNTFVTNGEGVVDGVVDAVVPIKPQEVYRAVRDGYAADLVGHWWHNGGMCL